MQKIVVGTIAVFFVQIAFQAYTAVERINEDYSAKAEAIPVSPAPQTAADVETMYALSSTFPAETQVSRRPTVEPRSSKPTPKTAINKGMLTARRPPAFPETTTFAPQPIADGELSADVRYGKKKRSLFAKIIKAPYDALKAVASKLH